MALIGAIDWLRALLLIITQMVAGIAAAAVVLELFPGPLSVRTTLSLGTSVVRGVFIEMFLTAQLVFCIFMLAAEKHKSTFLAPIGIGFALFIAELAGKRSKTRPVSLLTHVQVCFTREGLSTLPARLVRLLSWPTFTATTGSTGLGLCSVPY